MRVSASDLVYRSAAVPSRLTERRITICRLTRHSLRAFGVIRRCRYGACPEARSTGRIFTATG
jgi:hypothetical protein